MDANGHTPAALRLVVDLVNALTPGEARGRPVEAPDGDALRAAVADALAERPNRARDWSGADDDEHRALQRLAGRWRAVVEAVPDGAAAVAPLVNALLEEAPVAPSLVDHDGQPWHLHAHGPSVGPADGVAATAALALASVVADDTVARLGLCAASSCDRSFVDTSRNGSRRYCSAPCQARAKTAAYRARRA